MAVSSTPAGWDAKQVSGHHRRKFSETLVSEPPFGYFCADTKVPRPQAKYPFVQARPTEKTPTAGAMYGDIFPPPMLPPLVPSGKTCAPTNRAPGADQLTGAAVDGGRR